MVDDWSEVCWENIDIEVMYFKYGFKKEDIKLIVEVVVEEVIVNFLVENVIMFNFMGMVIFDMFIVNNYYKLV